MKRTIIAAGLVLAALSIPSRSGAQAATVNGFGQFTSGKPSSLTPVPSSVSLPGLPSQIQASNSGDYALVDGSEYAWGYGSSGELGDDAKANSMNTPVEVDFPTGVTVTDIGDSFDSGYAVDSNGHGWSWGNNRDDDHCRAEKASTVPTEVVGMPSVTATAGGGDHSLWLTSAGTVFACGLNSHGELGDGTTTKSAVPVEVSGLSDIVAISAGQATSAALTAGGQLYTWGQGGEDGTGTKSDVDSPYLVPGTFSQVYVGGSLDSNGHTLALTTSGQVEAWGVGYTNAPEVLSLPCTASSVMASGTTSGALDTSGDVWSWPAGKVWKASILDSGAMLLSGTADNEIDA